MGWKIINELNPGHIELELFVGPLNRDVLWMLGNEDLDLIGTKISRVWFPTKSTALMNLDCKLWEIHRNEKKVV